MATVSETINVTVAGVNPQTLTYSILMNTATGSMVSPPLAIPYVGNNAGVDSIVATMPSHSLTSNTAEISWQAANGTIAVSPITGTVYLNINNTPGFYSGAFNTVNNTFATNSLIFNQLEANFPLSGYPSPGYKVTPFTALQQASTGQVYVSSTRIYPGVTGNPNPNYTFVMDLTGKFVVRTPGTYTFYMIFANVSTAAMYIGGGASILYTGNTNGGANPFPATGPNAAFWNAAGNGGTASSHLALASNENPGLYGGVVSAWISFPTAGTYPFEAIYNQYQEIQPTQDNNGYFQICFSAGEGPKYANNEGTGNLGDVYPTFLPVSLTTAPAAGTVGSRQLQLSVQSGVATSSSPTSELELQSTTQDLYLTVSGIPYSTIPYIPVLEGQAGEVFLYDSGSNVFNFGGVVYPFTGGVAPSGPAAVANNVVSLSGDNTAWQGLFNLAYNGTSPSGYYTVNYTGGSVVANVDVTNLTITAEDIAWYDSADGSMDLFTASSGGDLQYPIQIAYMVMPVRSGITVTPSTLLANGATQTLTINLPKPLSPEQQGLYGTGNTVNVPTASASGGVVISTPAVAILNGNGWLVGWTLNVTPPSSTSSGSFQLTFGVTGTLTYLQGSQFVTNTITYISNSSPLATISTTGHSYTAPTNYSFVITGGLTGTTIKGSITLTIVIFSADNGSFITAPGSNSFFFTYRATKVVMGPGTLVSGPTAVAGGYHTTIKATVTSSYGWGSPLYFGYTAKDSLSGLSVSYTDSTAFNNGNAAPVDQPVNP